MTRLSRGTLAGVVAACAVLAGGGVAAASFLSGGTTSSARQAAVKNVTVGGAGAGNAAAAMPQVAASPRLAVMPKSTATAGRTGGPSPSGSATAPAAAGSATCTHPSFVTSDQYGMWNLAPYFVYNNKPLLPQVLRGTRLPLSSLRGSDLGRDSDTPIWRES